MGFDLWLPWVVLAALIAIAGLPLPAEKPEAEGRAELPGSESEEN
jgi:hypothetical protein